MRSTIPMEFTPSCTISFRYCLKNTRMRSGRANVRPINIKYLPRVAMGVRIIFIIMDAKVAFFVYINAKVCLILCSLIHILNFFSTFVEN